MPTRNVREAPLCFVENHWHLRYVEEVKGIGGHRTRALEDEQGEIFQGHEG
jgi:hypothetical protein